MWFTHSDSAQVVVISSSYMGDLNKIDLDEENWKEIENHRDEVYNSPPHLETHKERAQQALMYLSWGWSHGESYIKAGLA